MNPATILSSFVFLMYSPIASGTADAQASVTPDHPWSACVDSLASKIEPARTVVYKQRNGVDLHLQFFLPNKSDAGPRACFVIYHGGGWTGGSPRMVYSFAQWAAQHGMVGVSVEYRLCAPQAGVTVFDCVKDARSAIRYIREHAGELAIDPDRIVACGASAGGHLAVGTALFDGIDDEADTLSISCRPQALVLLSPVLDTSAAGYGQAKIGPRWKELSPVDRVVSGMPPTLVFHGTGDMTTPFAGAEKFQTAMQHAGNQGELVVVEGAIHTYMFKDAVLYDQTLQRMEKFLRLGGFIEPSAP